MAKRFISWAGAGWPDDWPGVLWPVVDEETEVVDGCPTPEQWYCAASTPEKQELVCKLLNEHFEKGGA